MGFSPDPKARTSDKVKDAMFEYWCEVQNIPAVVKKFKPCRTTVERIKRQNKWVEKYEKRRKIVLEKAESKAIKKMATNLEIAIAVKTKLFSSIIKKSTKLKASIPNLILLMEFEEKLRGNMPSDVRGGSIVNVFTALPDADRDGIITDSENVLETLRSQNRI